MRPRQEKKEGGIGEGGLRYGEEKKWRDKTLSCGLSVNNHGIDGVMERWSLVSHWSTMMLTLSAY